MISVYTLMVILGAVCVIAGMALLIVLLVAPIIMLCELLKEIFKDKKDR